MKIVFTIILGSYDSLRPVTVRNMGWRYVAIVDDMDTYPNGWELLHISSLKPPEGLNNVYLQRWAKTIGAVEHFKCDTIYIDGSHEILADVTKLFGERICFKAHPVRNCYITEGEVCKQLNKAKSADVDKQVSDYKALGVPEKMGMFETGILFRPYSKEVIDFCQKWWAEIAIYTHRDQLSVTKVMYDTGIHFDVIFPETFSKYIKIHQHK